MELGEVVSDTAYEAEGSKNNVSLEKHSPTFKSEETTRPSIVHCKTCGDPCTSANIDGECLGCAMKRMRHLETKLSQFNQLKQIHEFCVINGHGEIYKNKLHKDWSGKISINGVDLYPVFPLCKECLDNITGYLVYFLEERGIVRKGSGNSDNIFGSPYKEPLSILEKQAAVKKLEEFISAVALYTLDTSNPCSQIYTEIKERRKQILNHEMKGVKEWAEKKKIKLPQNQVETLALSEKYFPILKKLEEKTTEQEIKYLQDHPLPEQVLQLMEKELIPVLREVQLPKSQDLEKEKLSWQLLQSLISQQQKVKILTTMRELVGTQFANSVEQYLEEILGRFTVSEWKSKLTTNE